MQKKYADKGVVLVALSDEPAYKVKPFVKSNKMNYIVGMEARETLTAYGVKGFPTALIVDPSGKIIWRGHPQMPEAEETLEKALKETPPKVKTIAAMRAGGALAKADNLLSEKKYAKAIKEYERIAKAFKGSDTGRKASAKLKGLKADAQIMGIVRAEETKKNCEGWIETARALAKSGKDNKAAEYYQKVLDKYPDSEFAETSRAELEKLRG